MDKIPIVRGGASVWAYGEGAHVTADFVCPTVEAGLRLKEAIEGLTELLLGGVEAPKADES